jgi:predicted nucleic acid-binding protein
LIIDINPVIKDFTIKLRKEYSLKLPDSIIAATSLYINAPLITADTDFKKVQELDLILFE